MLKGVPPVVSPNAVPCVPVDGPDCRISPFVRITDCAGDVLPTFTDPKFSGALAFATSRTPSGSSTYRFPPPSATTPAAPLKLAAVAEPPSPNAAQAPSPATTVDIGIANPALAVGLYSSTPQLCGSVM